MSSTRDRNPDAPHLGATREITDWRIPEEWPPGAKPVTKKIKYDDLYRVARIDHEYADGGDEWHSPFARELAEADEATTPDEYKTLSPDRRRAQPSPHINFNDRVKTQTFEYDWLGNTPRCPPMPMPMPMRSSAISTTLATSAF